MLSALTNGKRTSRAWDRASQDARPNASVGRRQNLEAGASRVRAQPLSPGRLCGKLITKVPATRTHHFPRHLPPSGGALFSVTYIALITPHPGVQVPKLRAWPRHRCVSQSVLSGGSCSHTELSTWIRASRTKVRKSDLQQVCDTRTNVTSRCGAARSP